MAALYCALLLIPLLVFGASGVTPTRSTLHQRYDTDEIKVDETKHDLEFFKFVTRPDIDAPRWEIKVYNESAVAPGLWFVSPYGIVKQTDNEKAYVGPHIYDSNGDLIWSGTPLFNRFDTFTFKVSQVGGRNVLTALYPEGGTGVILDESYNIQKAVDLGSYEEINMHEFQIVDDGTRALYLKSDMEKYTQGSRLIGVMLCEVEYNGIEEKDIETGEITFTWSSKDHIGLDESTMYDNDPDEMCENDTSDYVHLNSIEKLSNGDYLVSGRRTNAIYRISGEDGSILWHLGGKKNDFEIDGEFSGQHDVRCLSENSTHLLLSILDNAVGPTAGLPATTNDYSRGLLLSVNTELMTAAVVKEFDHPDEGYAFERGSLQILPNGNAMAFWTTHALNSEYTPDGQLVKVASFPSGLKTYRGYKFEWTGRPKTPPDVHSEVTVMNGELTTLIYVSWNGATEVALWKFYKSNEDGSKTTQILAKSRTGFETSIMWPGYAQHVIVAGFDPQGNELGYSNVVKTVGQDTNGITNPKLIAEMQWLQDHPEAMSKPASWLDDAKSTARKPLFTFFGGIFFSIAAGLSSWGVWTAWNTYMRKRQAQLYTSLAGSDDDRVLWERESLELSDLKMDDND